MLKQELITEKAIIYRKDMTSPLSMSTSAVMNEINFLLANRYTKVC